MHACCANSLKVCHIAARRLRFRGERVRQHSSKIEGYVSIGSFHSENVEELLRLPDDQYRPPLLPFDSLPITSEFVMKEQQNQSLAGQENWTFLNHGAFGAALKCGYDRAQQWRLHLECQPLRFFDRDLLPHLVFGTRKLAKFVNAERDGIALLPNVTSGLNSVLSGYARVHSSSISSSCNDKLPKILLWDVSYGSVKKMARQYSNNNVIEIPLLHPKYQDHMGHEDIFLEALEDTLQTQQDWTNTLFIMDHTTSNTALNMPIERLGKRAKEAGMITLVDGAHGLLAQDIDFTKLSSIDMYLSNGHKWLSCPRGVAFLYCPREELRGTILRQPSIISHGLDDGYFSRFIWDGTRDYAAQLTLPVVLDFWTQADPATVRTWMRSKLKDAIHCLADTWHPSRYSQDSENWSGRVTLASLDMVSPMALVRLPHPICGSSSTNPKTSTDAKRIQDYLYDHHIEVPIKCVQNVLYVRLSCHIYNDLSEYDRLAHVMMNYPGK